MIQKEQAIEMANDTEYGLLVTFKVSQFMLTKLQERLELDKLLLTEEREEQERLLEVINLLVMVENMAFMAWKNAWKPKQ